MEKHGKPILLKLDEKKEIFIPQEQFHESHITHKFLNSSNISIDKEKSSQSLLKYSHKAFEIEKKAREKEKRKLFSSSKPLIKAYKENKRFVQMFKEKVYKTYNKKNSSIPFIDFYTQSQSNIYLTQKNESHIDTSNMIMIEHCENNKIENTKEKTFITNTNIKTSLKTDKIEGLKIKDQDISIMKRIFGNDLTEADQYNPVKIVSLKEPVVIQGFDQELKFLNKEQLQPKKNFINFNSNPSLKKAHLRTQVSSPQESFDSLLLTTNGFKSFKKQVGKFENSAKLKSNHQIRLERIIENNLKISRSKINKNIKSDNSVMSFQIATPSKDKPSKSNFESFNQKEKLRKFIFTNKKIPMNNFLFQNINERNKNLMKRSETGTNVNQYLKNKEIRETSSQAKLLKTFYRFFEKKDVDKMFCNK